MSILLALLAQVLHVALVLAAAPLLAGLIRRIAARLAGRVGPPLLQPWRDLLRLARKQPVIAENASPLTSAAPAVAFAASLAAAALVPSFALGMLAAPAADLLAIAGLLALARCTIALAAMDAGTAFGGIGASRAMTFAACARPGLILVIFTFALLAGTTNLDIIASLARAGVFGLRVSLPLALAATLVVAIGETGRAPVDHPALRQPLATVQEAMAGEFSGRHLALIEWAAALRLLAWLSLIVAIFVPFGAAQAGALPLWWLRGLLAWAAKIVVLAALLALFESMVARMPIVRVPQFLGIAAALGILALLLLFVAQGFA